ncbi:hypothetical protein GOP47_0018531 [Adiantum capillus-veneris]|uniref:DJ-1/PfpI domain-containing protein n=1 Tax=Adiantum capillus-veneris TaxID=13818 RepID=A0A9D4UDY8_ADICA|nr:hypothetical protein GOP47_0018531 [Adiantum capillus-veneris]
MREAPILIYIDLKNRLGKNHPWLGSFDWLMCVTFRRVRWARNKKRGQGSISGPGHVIQSRDCSFGGLVHRGCNLQNLAFACKILWEAHGTSIFTTSVCTGSLLLAAAGILDGLEATTHWNAFNDLEKLGVKPVSQRIVKMGKIITAAGVSAGIDMAIELAALLRDEETAKMLQLYIEYDPQPPYDVGSVDKAGKELVERTREFIKTIKAPQSKME